MKAKAVKIARSARKVAAKGKIKRWRKGQSSSSNPSASKHREAAKNRFFSINLGPSELTVDAVVKHNVECDGGVMDIAGSDADSHSHSARSFSTWASNWTDCTNITFNKVHRYWASNDAFHKEILAVLAAVTEVIKEKGGKETETEYFGAFLTSVDTVDTEESMAAVTYLLSLVIRKVPSEVLKSQFSNVAKKLTEVLNKHSSSESTSLLKSLLKTLASLLRAQDPATWRDASTVHVFNTLLSYSIHPKPKVRKQAHQCVCSVLKGSEFMLKPECPSHHPAASQTARYCVQVLEEDGASNNSSRLHVLGLLKEVMGVLPKHSVKAACETVLRLMTLSDVVTKSVCMQTLHSLFVSRPKPSSLPAELNAQIIVALYDYLPGINDSQPLGAWLTTMQQAHINLTSLDHSLCVHHLPRMFSTCMKCVLAERDFRTATDTIKVLIEDCLRPCMELLRQTMPVTAANSPLHRIVLSLESGLGYQYHTAWGQLLGCLSALIQVLGRDYHRIMVKCLSSMADLRDSHRFAYKPEVDHAFSVAIRCLGPRVVLGAVPLLINGDDRDNLDFPRSWLMPLLRDNIRETELAYFIDYFLPLAARLKERASTMRDEGSLSGAKTYEILHYQVWSLLPGFCTKPTDLKTSFKNLAKVLGSAIATKSEFQLESMASLRKLVLQNEENEDNQQELARFAKNYLPILFNLYSTDPDKLKDPVRLASLETIKFYVKITPEPLIASFYDKAFSKLQDSEVTPFTRHALMDLINTMLMYISADRLKTLYKWITPNLKNKDRTTQKKAYRALEELCGAQSATCRQFVSSHVTELQTMLIESLSTAHASSKAPRLRCLINIFNNLEEGDMSFIQSVLPEAILCTKETAERARAAAILLLIQMCEAGARWLSKPKPDVVLEYFKFILTGLKSESAKHVSTTLLALSRLLLHYRAESSTAILDLITSELCQLLTSPVREIVDSAISLLRVLIGSFKEAQLAKYLHDIVEGLVSMKEDNRHHFRFKAKDVLERLIRKFGYDTIRRMVPESHHKLLNNIRKTQERLKRKKKQLAEDEEEYGEDYQEEFKRKAMPESVEDFLKDSDSDLDDVQSEQKPKVKTKRSDRGGKAWLKEGNEDDMVDFLDKSAAQKIMGTEPVAGSSGGRGTVKHDFKTAADGRLIITENNDDMDEQAITKGSGKKEEVVNAEEILDAIAMKSGKFRKRKRDALPEDEEAEPAMKYKAGGSGIHRPIAVAKRLEGRSSQKLAKSRVSGDEYKAKKAGGDVKKKGRPDPYAYVPLHMSALNKRKQAKFQGQFGNFVKSARKGAIAGRKAKAKKSKK